MSGNTFGELFRVTTFGESHGPGLGVVVDGVPAGIRIDEALIQRDLDRRRPGQSRVSTARREADQVEILSGVFEGVSTGTPIGMIIRNNDQRSQDYGKLAELFRPGHADLTFFRKYGIRDYRGGGRSSGRETSMRVAAGALAGTVYGIALALSRKRSMKHLTIPFGPFLAGGALVWIFFGEKLLRGYLSLLRLAQ